MKFEDVEKINKILDDFGPSATQRYETFGDKVLTGFKPQYIIDAVNQVIGPCGWKHQVKTVDVTTHQGAKGDSYNVNAEVVVQLLDEQGTVKYETGSQFGSSKVVSGNYGDAKKGAVTDAIGKCFSLLSVGKKAYRGEITVAEEPKVAEPVAQRFQPLAGFTKTNPKTVNLPTSGSPKVSQVQQKIASNQEPTVKVQADSGVVFKQGSFSELLKTSKKDKQ